jgi:hypothetical protein
VALSQPTSPVTSQVHSPKIVSENVGQKIPHMCASPEAIIEKMTMLFLEVPLNGFCF